MGNLSKTWVSRGNFFEDFRHKKQKLSSQPFNRPNGTRRIQIHQLVMARKNSKT